MFAIMVHQVGRWKWKWPGREEAIRIARPDGEDDAGVKLSLSDLPIAHLLVLCDTFAQFGREFEEADESREAPRRIRMESIKPSTIGFLYEGWHGHTYSAEVIEKKFYANLARLLPAVKDKAGENSVKAMLTFDYRKQKGKEALRAEVAKYPEAPAQT